MTSTRPKAKKDLRYWLKRLGVLLVASIVAGLVAEGAVLLIFGEQVRFPRHVVGTEFGLRINEPNAVYRHRSPDVNVQFRINSQGMRADVDYAYEKPAGKLRILSLGDSFTAGYEVEVEDCFSSVLERELIAKGYDVEVLNAGVSGYSTAEECLYLERELLKYDPDVVLVSYYTNDPRDNFRSGLFELGDDDTLVQVKDAYVPMGKLANFLNTNFLFSFLSEHSNAFALLKDTATQKLKQRMVEETVESIDTDEEIDASKLQGRVRSGQGISYPSRLTAAIYERIYANLRARGIPLVIQAIPHTRTAEDGTLEFVNSFPIRAFDTQREGIVLVPSSHALRTYLGVEQLYYHRSNKHWTPLAHNVAGKAIAELIDANGLLTK